MQIRIESPHSPGSVAWRERAEQRVRFVLRRLKGVLMQVHVRLSDVNGPRGGVDQRCQVSLSTEGHGLVVVQALHGQPGPALDAALKRAAHALVRLWQKQRQPQRQAQRRPIKTRFGELAATPS